MRYRLKQVVFVSKNVVETIRGNGDYALISVGDPEESYPKITGVWPEVLRLEFHDIKGPLPGHVLFTYEQGDQIIEFVKNVMDKCSVLIVHCNAGISRSAAIARAIADGYELDGITKPDKFRGWDQDTFFKNKHVYKTMLDVLDHKY